MISLSNENEVEKPTLWTVGHSTRSADEFEKILLTHQISRLADVRSFPGSRRYPQFNREALARSLSLVGIEYYHLAELGGRRHARPDSKNTAWRNASFRGYADYMESGEFKRGIESLLKLARAQRTAIMCAEAVWWKCHRSLIADYLKSSGLEVIHISDTMRSEIHPYTPAARFLNGRLSYEGLLAG